MFWTTGSTGAAFSIEEEIQLLKIQMKEIIKSLEAKDAKMQQKVTEQESKYVEMQEEMKLKDAEMEKKVTQLETRNVQLETKVQEQENILTFLLKSAELPTSATGSKSIFNNLETTIGSTGRSGTPRTCYELRAADPTLPSGMQWIDPDGQGVGDGPIYVYCNMTTGSTSILHDSELPINVGHCTDPGCYSRAINYNASMKQMESLIALSAECHQSIKYDCYYAPFEFNYVPYAWWNDRDGNAQYFWAGNNTDGVHTCQCGIGGNCVDSSVKCNCDVAAPIQLVDDGVIKDKDVLPVTRLNFGRTQLANSSGIHTLGRLECTGSAALTRMPASCQDLWLIGHTLNGFYDVMGSAMMESVYCDFAKLQSDEGFEKWIGYADVKLAPVHFYVQRNSPYSTTGIIPFELAVVKDGNAMNLATGKFTAPRNGIYFFSFTGLASFPASTSSLLSLYYYLYLNGDRIGSGYVGEGNTVANQRSSLTLQSTLNLKKDDQIWMQIGGMSSGVVLFDDNTHYTHFTGFMLQEEIVSSLL